MKKAANILYLVASIIGFIGGSALAIIGPVFAILGALRVFDTATDITPKDAEAANLAFLVLGILFIVLAALYFVAAGLALKARKNLVAGACGKGIHIACIVFGVLTAEPVLIVPAIFSCCIDVEKKPEPEKAE